MKRIFVLICVAAIVSCTQTETKKEETTNSGAGSSTSSPSEADKRTKEIADSTTVLDKKLADPNDPHTPDSLK